MKLIKQFFVVAFILVLLGACRNEKQAPPVKLPGQNSENVIKIPYEERGGVKVIPVKLNGVSMDMIYDTGCSGVHLSLLELQQMAKQGKFSADDIIGVNYSCIADGSIVQNGEILLHSVEISPGLVLENIKATVALNQDAPLLLGDEVLDNIARSVEVDNIAKTINFKK